MHRLNGVGLAGLDRHSESTRSYAALSSSLSQSQIRHLESQLTIRADANFRHKFTQMCGSIGVDPLAGPRKGGWWAELMPGFGDWQYELGVQVVDVCVSTREKNGGMMELAEVVRLVTEEDIIRCIKTLQPLGAGYQIVDLGDGRKMVRSVPKELDSDQAVILALARQPGKFGKITEEELVEEKGWTRQRAKGALENMLIRDGLCWHYDRVYWVTSAMQWD
ncbi:winged helix DNA-binding domain-containing protein [Gymnopus androsaceus JB14]|uniref:Winged helix DNA-binding domain-containing protein n=1 Tax=Gymnopus androsaceus JB14 TaxID=1447944 RepID=A0A6A4HQW7_9AGAR|nr:winged helix DNA-binding domain-containing protein [Gymnopus androsaceus JB14]